ncbi:unnamed protein product [Aspergillus oryzae var. brunneus]|uniref:Unnamed protein product n=1 Tax=Aspergillus oryzae var. brunneus TaxID=332754 RepID=A0ABQ6KW61_ASPOZ|nr:unnamed protein product [Aspergillus oryzae var. brunneus]
MSDVLHTVRRAFESTIENLAVVDFPTPGRLASVTNPHCESGPLEREPASHLGVIQEASLTNTLHVSEIVTDQPTAAPPLSQIAPRRYHDEGLVNLFYANFHSAHPILLPRSMYNEETYPESLQLAVQFVDSHFSTTTSSDSLCTATAEALRDDDQQGFHLVQARLLFAIALHSRNEIRESVSVLADAVSLTINLGMNRKDFSQRHGNTEIEAESIRRTWWELYVIDGIMAALQRNPTFRCHTIKTEVLLPCDENLCHNNTIPEPFSMAQFDARVYGDEDRPFSSFTYRIDAVRLAHATLKKIKRMTAEVFRDVATYPEDQIDDSRDSGVGVSDTSVEIQLGELPSMGMLYWADYELT